MGTIYKKVAISEEPKHNGNYHCIFPEGHIFTIPFLKEYGFHDEFTDCSGITHYLEEIPDPTAQLQADKAELLEALEKVKRLEPIICMGGAVAEQWQNEAQALNEMMAEIESLIQKMKKCQENTPR